jgi:DNA-binding transcriptional ArsR family regulator
MVSSENEPDLEEVAQGFAAMGSEARLQVVLTLVRAGTDGLTIGDIQSRTGMPASTLAHHLKFLASAGLIEQEKQGRAVINRPSFPRLETLAGYILNQCCADLDGEPGD